MSRGINGALLRLLQADDFELEVRGLSWLSPNMRTITFSCPQLFAQANPTPGEYLRCWFPDPAGGKTEHQRGYTLCNIHAQAGTFDIHFLMHQPAGPAALWAEQAQVGQVLPVTRYAPCPFTPHAGNTGFLFVADTAGFPYLMATYPQVAQLAGPQCPIVYLLISEHAEDHDIPLPDGEFLHTEWLTPDRLAARLEAGPLPETAGTSRDWQGWKVEVTAESAVTKTARKFFKAAGCPKEDLEAIAYWKQGREMGKSRTS